MEVPVRSADVDHRGKSMTPRETAEIFALKFRGQATHLAYQFGGPVYLVGSALTSPKPGDIDIRLVIAREDAVTFFGDRCDDSTPFDWPPGKHLKHREELKQSRRMTRGWSGTLLTLFGAMRVDFQFQIGLFNDTSGLPIFDDKPRIRLDAMPLEYFDAGRGAP